jgi:dienelactone hydrolase
LRIFPVSSFSRRTRLRDDLSRYFSGSRHGPRKHAPAVVDRTADAYQRRGGGGDRSRKSWDGAKRLGIFRVGALAALIGLGAFAGSARAEGLREETLTIPAVVSAAGRPSTVPLEAIVLRPDDGLAHPLAVINHGSPRNVDDRAGMSPFDMWAQAREFARRGWAAAAFMRRGYGRSPGGWAETYGSCADPNYARAGRAGAQDIAAVAKFMASQPYVAKGGWISVGVSAGAFATLALTADAPPGLAAAISFAPGRGSTSSDSVCEESRLVQAFAEYGATSRTPLLWVSADNDRFFGPRLVDRLTEAFSRGGAKLSLIRTQPFGADGHGLFSAKGIPLWTPIVDRFLKANGLALRTDLIEIVVPAVPPPPSLDARGREAFATYLASGPNKAFAVGPGTRFGWATGRRAIDQAKTDALRLCAASAAAKCAIGNVNDSPER